MAKDWFAEHAPSKPGAAANPANTPAPDWFTQHAPARPHAEAGGDKRSRLAKAIDVLLTPLVSPERAQSWTGAETPTPQGSLLPTVVTALKTAPYLLTGRAASVPLEMIEQDPNIAALVDIGRNALTSPSTIPGMVKAAGQGVVEGLAQLSDPLTIASTLTLGASRAVHPVIVRALRALPEAERALIAMRAQGNLDEVVRLRAEIQALRSQADVAQALTRFARGVDVGSSGLLTARGVERIASAESPSETGAGLAQAALGAVGLKTAPTVRPARTPVPLHAGELPPAAGFRVTPEGTAVPPGAEVPMVPAPDGSYVRAEPAEYARREVRGALPPGPNFIVDESGRAVPLDAEALLADVTTQIRSRSSRTGNGGPDPVTTPAPVADFDLSGRPIYSSDPAAPSARAVPLDPREQVEVRAILAEMEAMPFTKHSFVDPGVGKGGSLEIVPGGGGAPVYQDIVALHGRSAGRDAIMDGLRKTLEGQPSAYGPAIREIARQRLRGALRRTLPEDAGVRSAHLSGEMSEEDFAKFSDTVDDWATLGAVGEPGERGAISPALLARMGSGAAGATYGAATGETPEDRLQRALTFGVAGVVAPSLIRGGNGTTARSGSLLSGRFTGSGEAVATAPTTGRPAPPPKQPMRDPLAGVEPFLSKFPEEMRTPLRQVLEDNAGFQAQRRGTVGQQHVEQLAERVRVDMQRNLRSGTALNAEAIRAHVDALAGAQARVDQLAAKVRQGQNTDADVLALESARAQVNTLLTSIMGARSEAGRALAQFRTIARVLETGNPELMANAAQLLRGNAAEFAAQFAKVPGDSVSRYQWLRGQITPTLRERARQMYYANILSGLKTHERNIIGNAFNVLTNLAVKPTAVAVDAVKAAASNRPREIFFSEIPSEAFGAFVGLRRGFSDALFSARHGVNRNALTQSLSAAEAGKLDVPRVEFGGGGANPFNWPGRALDAADQFFRGIAKDSALYSLAHAKAKQEGKRGHAMTVRMSELLAGGDEAGQRILAQADEYARRTVFQEKGGRMVSSLQVLAEKVPEVSLVLPFIRTPGNILKQGFEFSPAGFLMKAAKAEGRTGTEAQGRAVMGSMALGGLAYLLATDQIEITGSGPADRAERAQWMESGKRANSLKIGGSHVQYTLAQPVSVPLMVLANAMEAWKADGAKQESVDALVASVVKKTARSVVDLSFLSGVADLFAALEEDAGTGLTRIASRTAHSMTPFAGAQRTVTEALDPKVRKPEGIWEGVKANVPGLSTSVPARLDRFGNEVQRQGGPLRRAADPFNVTPETKDPVLLELSRIHARVGFPANRLAGLDLTREQKRAVEQIKGRATHAALQRMFRSELYQGLDDSAKARAVDRLVAKVRSTAAKRLSETLGEPDPATVRR